MSERKLLQESNENILPALISAGSSHLTKGTKTSSLSLPLFFTPPLSLCSLSSLRTFFFWYLLTRAEIAVVSPVIIIPGVSCQQRKFKKGGRVCVTSRTLLTGYRGDIIQFWLQHYTSDYCFCLFSSLGVSGTVEYDTHEVTEEDLTPQLDYNSMCRINERLSSVSVLTVWMLSLPWNAPQTQITNVKIKILMQILWSI